jgi:hypothetical protein
MYIWHNWHPWYGIGHNIFSASLSLLLIQLTPQNTPALRFYFFIMARLFLVETGFAWYMLHPVAN